MSGGSSVLWCLPASIPLQGDSVSSVGFYGCVCGVSLLLFPCRWSMVHRLGGVSLGEMWGGSSVGFYGCVGGAFLIQSLAG